MSFDLYVLVPRDRWPTAHQLDEALAAEGFPVRLGARDGRDWNAPVAPVVGEPTKFLIQNVEHAEATGKAVGDTIEFANEIVMPLQLEGRELDPDFGIDCLADPADVNAQLKEIGADITAMVGDYLVWFSHHSDRFNYNASMYVLSALIRRFGAYGFEFQGMSHGQEQFASELLGSLYQNLDENDLA